MAVNFDMNVDDSAGGDYCIGGSNELKNYMKEKGVLD